MTAPPFVLLDHGGGASNNSEPNSLLITNPDAIIVANSGAEVGTALSAIDQAVADGYTVAGFTAYEAAGALEPRLSHLLDDLPDHPLIWYAVSKTPDWLTTEEVALFLSDNDHGTPREAVLELAEPQDLSNWFEGAFDQVQNYLHAGDVFQVNLTYPNKIQARGPLPALYRQLRAAQPAPFSAFIDTGDMAILSVSPEQFLKRNGATLEAKPMKGTAKRGRWAQEDETIAAYLKTDEKSRAENLMIVDLMRNDLSRLAEPASVSVPALFEIESYKSVHQMTSTIRASITGVTKPSDTFKAVFPCGSVTGAPKIRAMEIINELERVPRGVYCGTIARFEGMGHKADWSMNVPIRTVVLTELDRANGSAKGRLNVGAGLVADSECNAELAECRLKTQFAAPNTPSPMVASAHPAHLIESLRLELVPEAGPLFPLLDRHLARLTASAESLGYPCQIEEVEEALFDHAALLTKSKHLQIFKVRLLLSVSGNIAITSANLDDYKNSSPVRLAVADHRLDPSDPWLFHKTTNRRLYDLALTTAQKAEVDDLLFLNDEGDVCESAIYSIFLPHGENQFLTPPLRCGLLPSVLRSKLIDEGKAIEHPIRLTDLYQAPAFYVGNAVRGLRSATLVREANGVAKIVNLVINNRQANPT